MALQVQRWNGSEWVTETLGSGSGSGTSNHAGLTNLIWVSSAHEGTANTFAGFDSGGAATEYTETGYVLADGTRAMTSVTLTPGTVPTPVEGLVYYDSTANKLKFYNGSAWETVTSA